MWMPTRPYGGKAGDNCTVLPCHREGNGKMAARLFVLAHAIMQTDYKYSSVVFLHIQSADSKVKLVDRLVPGSFR